mgnify:CR=1 FL=1
MIRPRFIETIDGDPVDISDVKEAVNAQEALMPRTPDEYYSRVAASLGGYRKAYDGGAPAVEMLIRRPGEPQQIWDVRCDYFENIPLVGTVVDERATALYGLEPKRCWYLKSDRDGEVSKELDARMNELYQENGAASLYHDQIGTGLVRDMGGGIKFVYDDDFEDVSFFYRKKEQLWPIPSIGDASRYLGLVEIVPSSKGNQAWLWTTHQYGVINANWEWERDWPKLNPEPPGLVPFALFGSWRGEKHLLADTVLQQRTAINLRSLILMGIRGQTFAVPFASGNIQTQEVVDIRTGEKYMRATGPDGIVKGDKDATFDFKHPEYHAKEMTEVETEWTKNWLGMNKVSPFAINASMAPEQPTSLMIKLYPTQDERRRMINQVMRSEKEAMLLAARLFLNNRPDVLPGIDLDDIEYDVIFPPSSLPADAIAARSADVTDEEASRLLTKDYLKRHVYPEANEEQLSALMELLNAQRAERAAMVQEMVNGASPPSRSGVTDEQGGTEYRHRSPAAALLDRISALGSSTGGGMAAAPGATNGGGSGPPGPGTGGGGGGRGGSPVVP